MKDNYQNIKFRRIIYTYDDRLKYGNNIPDVVNFNDYLFYENGFSYSHDLKEVEIPNNMMELSDGMFSHCSNLTKTNIPSSITKIGDNCFKGCISIKEINIPPSGIEIGINSFHYCSELELFIGNVDV